MMNDELEVMKRLFDEALSSIHHSSFRINSLAFIILLLCSMQVQAAVTARLDRSQISEGETVTLQVQVQGRSQAQPDTSPLTKDFDVLGVSSSSQVNIINGEMNALTTWNISLAPKRGGALEIPPLEVNGEQTQPLKLTVSNAPVASAATGDRPIFIETEVDRTDPYVQGMVRYRVKIYFAVRLLDARMSPPDVDNAMLEQLVEDKQYSVDRNGKRYQVIERQYALFPQKSGAMKLPGVVLDAKILDPNVRRRSPFGSIFGRDPFDDPFFGGAGGAARSVRLRGEAITLDVQPRPPGFKGHYWIPAESLLLTEDWQPEEGDIRVGDPVTRTISIQATGLKGEQLPELKLASVKGFKIYPDKSKADSRNIGLGFSGTKSRSYAFVPTRAGKFTIPAVKLHWWDIKDNKERVAELPARTIEILSAVGGQQMQSPSAPTPAQQPVPNQNSVETKPSVEPTKINGSENSQTVVAQENVGFWPWTTLLFALMWLVTLFLWWRGRGLQVKMDPEESARPQVADATAREARAEFLAACNNNDPNQARKSLLSWAGAHWPENPPKGLSELANLLDDANQAQLLKDLDSVVYSGSSQNWSGEKLAESLTRLPKKSAKGSDQQPLPALYSS